MRPEYQYPSKQLYFALDLLKICAERKGSIARLESSECELILAEIARLKNIITMPLSVVDPEDAEA